MLKTSYGFWVRRSHHEALHNMLPSKLPLLFDKKPDSGYIVSDHVHLLYTWRIFHYLVEHKMIEGNV